MVVGGLANNDIDAYYFHLGECVLLYLSDLVSRYQRPRYLSDGLQNMVCTWGALGVYLSSSTGYYSRAHRQFIKQHFALAGTKSRVLSALALLTESGIVYSAILVRTFIVLTVRESLTDNIQIVVAIYDASPMLNDPSSKLVFSQIARCFIYGCLIPLVVSIMSFAKLLKTVLRFYASQAIYPTVIIVLVVLKQSPVEKGRLLQADQSHGASRASEGDTCSTMVFCYSTSNISIVVDTEIGDV